MSAKTLLRANECVVLMHTSIPRPVFHRAGRLEKNWYGIFQWTPGCGVDTFEWVVVELQVRHAAQFASPCKRRGCFPHGAAWVRR